MYPVKRVGIEIVIREKPSFYKKVVILLRHYEEGEYFWSFIPVKMETIKNYYLNI